MIGGKPPNPPFKLIILKSILYQNYGGGFCRVILVVLPVHYFLVFHLLTSSEYYLENSQSKLYIMHYI